MSKKEKETKEVSENTEQAVEKTEVEKELEALQKKYEETNDLLLRTAAEFDNYKKRETAAKEKLSSFDVVVGSLSTPVL